MARNGFWTRPRRLIVASGVVLPAVAAAMLAFSTSAFAETRTETFEPASSNTEFHVPASVTQVEVSAIGGTGQPGGACLSGTRGAGGSGAALTATLEVSAGETLHVQFGGGGAGGPGCASGGAGGSASELLSEFSTPLLIAGGGGGGGSGCCGSQGGAGGS